MRLELDKAGVVEGDNDPPQAMGDANIEVRFFDGNSSRSHRVFFA
jgi:suppressor of tumorigenicity protein 13